MGIICNVYYNFNFGLCLSYYAVNITPVFGDFCSFCILFHRFMRSSIFTNGLRINAMQRRDPASHPTKWEVNIFNTTVGGIFYG